VPSMHVPSLRLILNKYSGKMLIFRVKKPT
jgi:hypothetical protein